MTKTSGMNGSQRKLPGERFIASRGAPFGQALGKHGIADGKRLGGEHLRGKECSIGRAGFADSKGSNRDAFGHLDDGKQRIHAVERSGDDGNTKDGDESLGGEHAGQMRGSAGACDDGAKATRRRSFSVFKEPIRGAVGTDDTRFMRDVEGAENLDGGDHGLPVAPAAHDDANDGTWRCWRSGLSADGNLLFHKRIIRFTQMSGALHRAHCCGSIGRIAWKQQQKTMTEQPEEQDRAKSSEGAGATRPGGRWRRALRLLHPSHSHTAFSATVLLMATAIVSRLIGLVRVKYIAMVFGRGMQADAFIAAFQLPDMIAYFLVGGAASITFVTILTQYRDTGREAEGMRSLSVILTTMVLVLGGAIGVAEWAAPWCVHWLFPGFDAEKTALCVRLTRILLPAQLCFFAGGVYGAVLLVRRQFAVQAVAPLIYSMGTIVGGLLLASRFGVESLAWGTLVGAAIGPFLLNAAGAWRVGARYRPELDFDDPGFREWVRLSVPLMVGVSLVTADNWIISFYASHSAGAVSLMSYAKQLFTAPMAVVAQAAGAASMPFFARLWAMGKRYEFAVEVADAVSRVMALGVLAASGMIALAPSLVELILVGGRLHAADAATAARYFAVFSISLFLWSAQAIYARAFYAAGNTLAPMVAGTVVTLASLPVYAGLFHAYGAMGLAVASDVGIAAQTVVLAVLLHGKRMVSLASLDGRELVRCAGAGVVGGAAAWAVARAIALAAAHSGHGAGRVVDVAELTLGAAAWLAVTGAALSGLGSALPAVARKRLGLA